MATEQPNSDSNNDKNKDELPRSTSPKPSFRDALITGLSSDGGDGAAACVSADFMDVKPTVTEPPSGYFLPPPEVLAPPKGYNVNPRKPLGPISKESVIPNPTTRSRRGPPRRPPLVQYGENGCLEFSDAGLESPVLAISQFVRDGEPFELVKLVLQSGKVSDIVDLITLVFVTRNTRGGKGEKKLGYDMFLTVWGYFPETAKKLLPLFPHYGYWKDLLLLIEYSQDLQLPFTKDLRTEALSLMLKQYNQDVEAIQKYEDQEKSKDDGSNNNDDDDKKDDKLTSPQISLLAKWLPRERTSLDKKLKFVNHFVELQHPGLDLSPPINFDVQDEKNNDNAAAAASNDQWKSSAKSKYRKQVTKMTRYLDLPEVLLSAQRADEIKIGRLASKATNILTSAFLNENNKKHKDDPKRQALREKFLKYLSKYGLKGGQVMPHEIVQTIMDNPSKITKGKEHAMNAQWKDLWDGIVKETMEKAKEEGLEFNPTRMVPLCDVSGSMHGIPMIVCIALGIGISEITHEAFRDMILTFSANPKWHRLRPTDTIVQKVKSLQRADWGMNTDFAKAYDKILDICRNNKLQREDVPALIVFSDMQFDQACCYRKPQLMFDDIRAKFKEVGEQLGWDDCEPTPIVFWNLRNTGGHPVNKDTEGTVLLSGFSPSLLKLIMNGDALQEEEVEIVEKDGTTRTEKIRVTPEQILQRMLEDSLYDPVRQILAESNEGILAEYIPELSKESSASVVIDFVVDETKKKKDNDENDEFVCV